MTNLARHLVRTAEAHPERPALRLDEQVLDYRTLDERSARVAAWLADRGVGPGDRVAVVLPNVPHFAVAYYGALRAGAVVVPMNPLLKSGRSATAPVTARPGPFSPAARRCPRRPPRRRSWASRAPT